MNEQIASDTNSDATTDAAPAVASLAMITIDAPDAEATAALGRFWQAVLGWPVAYEGEGVVMLQGPAHALGIGAVGDFEAPTWPDAGRKQFHLDLAVEGDLEAAAARCVELGATKPQEQPGETWIVLLDPVGHPFCLTEAGAWA